MKRLFFVLSFLSLLFVPGKIFSQSNIYENITSFNEEVIINQDSTLQIKEEIRYYFPSPRHGITRYIPYRYLDKTNNKNFKTPIQILSVTDENNLDYKYSQKNEENNLVLKIGDANKTITGEHTYIISYKIQGVINYFPDHDEFYWNVTGDGWLVAINNVNVSVTLPENVDPTKIQEKCFTGETGSTSQNCTYDGNKNKYYYSAKEGPLTIVLGWNKGVVTELPREYEISFRRESGWFWLILPLIFVWLLISYFRKGKDPFGRGTIAPEFDTPENLHPAEIGAIIDEKVDDKDISATIVDFAVKGYLKIKKKDSKYSLIKVKEADNSLKGYEKELFAALFKKDNEFNFSSTHINDEIAKVKDTLYQDLVSKKYFVQNPNKVRKGYLFGGILVIFIASGCSWLSWHLVFALGLSGVLIIIFSKFMPKKTKEGVILKEKSLGLKEFLYRADRYKLKWQETQHIFEKFLPYAMVLGVVDQWAKNFKDIYKEPPDWYQGDLNSFNAIIIASQMSSFSSAATSAYSPPASSGSSGFSGGGGGGGGFGGGGGGSW